MSHIETYRGWLRLDHQKEEEDDVLCITECPHVCEHCYQYIDGDNILASLIQRGIRNYGAYLSVQYFVSNVELPLETLQIEWLNRMEGLSDAKYEVRWSDITGYLWTDEDIHIGGHDLLEELQLYVGKFLHCEVIYSDDTETFTL